MQAVSAFAKRHGLPATLQALDDIADVLRRLKVPRPAHRPPGLTKKTQDFEVIVHTIDAGRTAEGKEVLAGPKLAKLLRQTQPFVPEVPLITPGLTDETLAKAITRARARDKKSKQ